MEILAIKTKEGYYISTIKDQNMFSSSDLSFATDKIPKTIMLDAADNFGYMSDDGFVWNNEYAMYSSLYKYCYDELPPEKINIEFTFNVIMELDINNIETPIKFEYQVQKNRYSDDSIIGVTNRNIIHQLADKIIFPSVILHERPCKMSSHDMYKIVRQYIKQNINYDVAEITSDYDFCFKVTKKIKLTEPYTSKWEIKKNNGGSYKKPKFRTSYVVNRFVEIFEMTYDEYNYKGYTPIPEMEANNEKELKENIDKLCEYIITKINNPIVDCPHCKGSGIIEEQKINLKEV